jgi:hypothetical protein
MYVKMKFAILFRRALTGFDPPNTRLAG